MSKMAVKMREMCLRLVHQVTMSKMAVKMREIIIIHKFSIALFPAERAQRACSHTCT